MTFLEKFCSKLEPVNERKNVFKSFILGTILYIVLNTLIIKHDPNNYANLFLITAVRYIIFSGLLISIFIRIDEYYFYYKLQKEMLQIMVINDITTIMSFILLYII